MCARAARAADTRRSCVFDASTWAVCVAHGAPRLKSEMQVIPGQKLNVFVQDPIVPSENACRGIGPRTLDRFRVQMFIELLRAREGYYHKLHVPGFDDSTVFTAANLLHHQAAAEQFLDACRVRSLTKQYNIACVSNPAAAGGGARRSADASPSRELSPPGLDHGSSSPPNRLLSKLSLSTAEEDFPVLSRSSAAPASTGVPTSSKPPCLHPSHP